MSDMDETAKDDLWSGNNEKNEIQSEKVEGK